MKTFWIALIGLALAGGAAAEDKPASKSKSEKNSFQKAESSIGDWANRNKIWITHKNEKSKKDEKKKK
jgi:hypothetical protein